MLDASAAIAALLGSTPARHALLGDDAHCPHLIDAEILNVMRRRARRAASSADEGRAMLEAWSDTAVRRHPTRAFWSRMWDLRHHLSAYDACYVALAEALGTPLVTADARIAVAPGLRCLVQVVPTG